jgi:hypothetical protein
MFGIYLHNSALKVKKKRGHSVFESKLSFKSESVLVFNDCDKN